ncbi:MAG TPA: mitofilin family membrane protein [Telmatospirillum sp.]|nr:mitofilin family membrane protein [Telmatospirillum sp.]
MTDSKQDISAPVSSETTVERPDEPTHASPKSSIPPLARGFFGGLVGGIAVSAVVGGGLVAAWPSLHDVLLGDETRRLSLLEHAIDDLNPRLVAVERDQNRSAGAADATGMAQNLAQKVSSLEAQAHAPLADPRIGALSDRTDRLSADMSRLTADIQALRGAIPPEGTILRLAERTEAAEKEVRGIAQQHASAQALLLVVGQLRDAVNRGDPYAFELQVVRRIANHDDMAQVDSLAVSAAEGVARRELLLGQFPAVAKSTVQADLLPPDDNLWQRALRKVMSLVDIRKVDGQGTSAVAVVARAETWIKDGDLTKAVQEIGTLTGRPAEAAAPWLKAARDRLAADKALSELSASTAAQSASASANR